MSIFQVPPPQGWWEKLTGKGCSESSRRGRHWVQRCSHITVPALKILPASDLISYPCASRKAASSGSCALPLPLTWKAGTDLTPGFNLVLCCHCRYSGPEPADGSLTFYLSPISSSLVLSLKERKTNKHKFLKVMKMHGTDFLIAST